MSEFHSVAVPFVRVGNRRCLTDEQLCQDHPELRDFVARFADSFERDHAACIWRFVEPE